MNEYTVVTRRGIRLRWYAESSEQAEQEALDCGHQVMAVVFQRKERGFLYWLFWEVIFRPASQRSHDYVVELLFWVLGVCLLVLTLRWLILGS